MAHATSSRSSKRQRAFGAPSEEDLPSAQPTHNIFSDAISTRDVSSDHHVPSLVTLCAQVFVKHIKHLSSDAALWDLTHELLKMIPDSLVPKLFAMLRTSCPTLLSHGFIIANFLRGSSITLTGDLRVNKYTIDAVTRAGQTLKELRLIGFEKFSDDTFASIMPKLPFLQVLVLRSCIKVGAKTVEAAANYCPLLTTVDLCYTAATPSSVASIVLKCPELASLKLMAAQNWTDANFAKFLSLLPQSDFRLPKLRKLKLRQTALSDASISPLLALCPNLESLDLSFTLIRNLQKHIDADHSPSFLYKLDLTSTSISSADLLAMLPRVTLLKTLSLGALGSRQGSTLSITNSSAMTLTEHTLNCLTDILSHFDHLEKISLVGNTKLCLTSTRALPRFLRQVGRRCKKLNLAGIPSLRSQDLAGLLPPDGTTHPSPMQTLILNNTGIDDESAPFISSCPDLQSLEVAGTKFTSEGLFSIIDCCPKLEKLDLTSCRGVRVVDRRRFFEVWKDERDG